MMWNNAIFLLGEGGYDTTEVFLISLKATSFLLACLLAVSWMSFILPSPRPRWVMGCGAAEVTGLGFVCRVVSQRCWFWAFMFHKFFNLPPPQSLVRLKEERVLLAETTTLLKKELNAALTVWLNYLSDARFITIMGCKDLIASN